MDEEEQDRQSYTSVGRTPICTAKGGISSRDF